MWIFYLRNILAYANINSNLAKVWSFVFAVWSGNSLPPLIVAGVNLLPLSFFTSLGRFFSLEEAKNIFGYFHHVGIGCYNKSETD